VSRANGIGITILLILSVVFCFIKKEKKSFYFFILFVVYYIWVSTRSISGCRQALPAILALIFLLCSMIKCLFYSVRKSWIRAGIFFGFLLYFLYFNTVKKDLYITKNFNNYKSDIYPYDKLMDYFKREIIKKKKLKVYAPMIGEPSHFYLAKYDIAKYVLWDRKIPLHFTMKSFYSYFDKKGFEYLVLLNWDKFRSICDEMRKVLPVYEIFQKNGNTIYVFKK